MKNYPKQPQIFFTPDFLAEATYDAIIAALQTGYRYFSFSDENSELVVVGRALQDWFMQHPDADRNDYFFQAQIACVDIENNQTRNAIARIVKTLGLDFIDCLVLSRPSIDFNWTVLAWYELKVHQEWGVVRNIGVANCDKDQILYLMQETGVKPVRM